MSDDVLEHETRKKIYNHILAYPGVSFNIIKNVLDLTDGTLRYHLKYLEGKNEIRTSKMGKIKCYYPVHQTILGSRFQSGSGQYKLSDTNERLINIIQRQPGITQKEIILKTRLKKITAVYNINKLVKLGLIKKEKNGKIVHYYYMTDEDLRKKILNKLIKKLLDREIDEHTFLIIKKRLDL